MKTILKIVLVLVVTGCTQQKPASSVTVPIHALYQHQSSQPRWSSPENDNGERGAGGKENSGAKGRPSVALPAGKSIDLLDISTTGVINRIWITIDNRSPQMLRSLKIEMFWDNESKPAVSAPFGDFFGIGLGRTTPFENELFANAEGRSFNCFIPMPFKSGAKIRVTNESTQYLNLMFYDVDYQELPSWSDENLYFHTYWNRDTATTLARDFEMLPTVKGKGRFLGVNIDIHANPKYETTWWGEGEVKMYLDGDTDWPTLNGTGTEDYIGTAWGQGKFMMRYTGCLIADEEHHEWAYYRYHIPDPIFFTTDCKVSIQQMGGGQFEDVKRIQNNNVPLIPVTINTQKINPLYTKGKIVDLDDPKLPQSWTNFYRSDDVASTAYFYLDKPVNELPELAGVGLRTYKMKKDVP